MKVTIETLDDVLPHISYDDGMVVSEREGYTVVDYVFATPNTFANPVAQQCRGLKFGADGRIIARPFHKFFNIGEREQPHEVDFTRPHVIMDKLDGSMIHPAILDGELVFMTRMGMTDQARAAQTIASDAVIALCRDALAAGLTPMFEFTSPDNRIVVEYADARLTLLAAREVVSGAYLGHAALMALAVRHGVPVADTFGQVTDPLGFVAQGRALSGVEGYVVAFEDGHRLKLKADAYVLRHKALSGLAYEKNILAWVVADAVDDVLPLLHADTASRVAAYQAAALAALAQREDEVRKFAAHHDPSDRRAYAMAAKAQLDKRLQPAAFAIADGRDPRAALMKLLSWAAHSETRMAGIKDLFPLQWEGADLAIKDV